MESTKLMKLVPLNDNSKNIQSGEMLKKILLVVLKIASVKGYNSDLNILYNNNYIQGSNVVDYIYEIFEMDKSVDERFINLLFISKITPDMFLNVNARNQLKEL